jgi:hypothetical protein
MTAPLESSIQTVCKHWLSAATTLLACQWKLFEVQYEAGLKIMERAIGSTAPPRPLPPAAPTVADQVRELERRAAERVSHGLAPPREAYQSPYRDQIDWGKFPAWARPSDPELFEGSGHEG